VNETLNSRAIKIGKHDHVYNSGDQDEMVYFIESGQIKLLMLSPAGHSTAGGIFGELCLSGLGARLETATAMEETILKQIPCSKFFARLSNDALFDGFVQYLAMRIADQQQVIANLVMSIAYSDWARPCCNWPATSARKTRGASASSLEPPCLSVGLTYLTDSDCLPQL
jgi:CRP-like cAMP-binding protein